MFSAQAGQIANALKAAGLSPDAAQKIASILGNGVQNLVRTNPETVDLTPESLRYVTPERRTYELPGLDFRQADPDWRPSQFETSEERPDPQQAQTLRREPSPQQTTSTYRVKSGKFTEAKGTGDSVQVDLRVTGKGRGALIDQQGNTLVGKTFRCEADENLRFFIEETGTELVWKLQLGDFLATFGTEVEVVTDVVLTDTGLDIQKRKIRVLGIGDDSVSQIPTDSCID